MVRENTKSKSRCIRIPRDLDSAIDALARDGQETYSGMVVLMLRKYLEKAG